MYTYISKSCIFEAKEHTITNHLMNLAQRVENMDYQAFSTNLEMFAYPFYVKKKFGYNYRLLAKLAQVVVDGEKYSVVVFFKIFGRGDDDYDDLAVKDINSYYGEELYRQQKLDDLLVDHLKTRLQNKNETPHCPFDLKESQAQLYQAKQNTLPLATHHALSTLGQSTTWRYGICPFLDNKKKQQVFMQLQNGCQDINVAYHTLNFTPTPNPSIGKPDDMTFGRHIPIEALQDKDLWLKSNAGDFPVYLNDLQDSIIQKLFYTPDAFPLIVDSPHNTGKTSLLAMLYVHFNLQHMWQAQEGDFLPCLLICQSHEIPTLHKQIHGYVQFLHAYNPQLHPNTQQLLEALPELLPRSCTDLHGLLLSTLDDDDKQRFALDKFIAPKFKKLLHANRTQNTPKIHDELCQAMLKYVFKDGQMEEFTNHLNGLTDNEPFVAQLYDHIKQHVWQKWYQGATSGKNPQYWDIQDLLAFVQHKNTLPKYASLLVDDAHTLSRLAIDVLLGSCLWQEHGKSLSAQIPLIFMGNGDDALSASFFAWRDELSKRLYQFYGQAPLDIKIVNSQADKPNVNVYFIDKDDNQALHALLSGKRTPLIANVSKDNRKQYLLTEDRLCHWFHTLHFSQLDTIGYGMDYLPPKSYGVALIGFYYPELPTIFNPHSLAGLTFDRKGMLDSRLHNICRAASQGLYKVFIVGNKSELGFWSAYFNKDIPLATPYDINECYAMHQTQLAQDSQIAKDMGDFGRLGELAECYYQDFDYQSYGKMVRYIYRHSDRYPDLSLFAKNDEQRNYLLDYLWAWQEIDALLAFSDFPQERLGNLYALQLYKNLPIKDTQSAITLALRMLISDKETPYKHALWRTLLPVISKKIQQEKTANEQFYQQCTSLLNRLGHHWGASAVLGFLAYQLGDFERCQTQYQAGGEPYPDLYYKARLHTHSDWQEQLLCHIALNHKETVMSTLHTQDLNKLQLAYWDRLLPYLQDDENLEWVIKNLLPHIHNEEVLDKLIDYCQDNTSENFEHRLERFVAVQSCLTDNLPDIIKMIKDHAPITDFSDIKQRFAQSGFQVKPSRKESNKKTKTLQKIPDILGDILHALHFCPALKICQSREEFEQYAQDSDVTELFTVLRKIFACKVGVNPQIARLEWDLSFDMARYLLILLEKSPEPFDAISAYICFLERKNNKEVKAFVLERLSLIFNQVQHLDKDAETSIIGEEMQAHYKSALQEYQKATKHHEIVIPENPYDLTRLNIKTKEERINSILALTPKENAKKQRVEQIIKEQELVEQKRLEEEARLEHERLEKERLEQEEKQRQEQERLEEETRQEQERLKQEQAERERLEKERQDQLEKERLAQAQLEQARLLQEQLEQDRLKQEQLAQQQAEHERLEQERQENPEQQHLEQERSEPEQLTQTQQTPTPPVSTATLAPITSSVSPTCDLLFFNWRVFVSRLYGRVNVESLQTGERWSLHLPSGQVQSDWQYQTNEAGVYQLIGVPLVIYVEAGHIRLKHIEQGAYLGFDL